MIRQLVYRSRATYEFGADDMIRLLLAARERNGREHITGVLLYRDRVFMQLLEGERDAVEAMYARIGRDPRHDDVHVERIADRDTRLLPGWNMGYAHGPVTDGLEPFPGLASERRVLQLLDATADDPVADALRAFMRHDAETAPSAG